MYTSDRKSDWLPFFVVLDAIVDTFSVKKWQRCVLQGEVL